MAATVIVRKDQPAKDPTAPSSPALADADVSGLTLVGRTASLLIGPSITTCELERTIDGASNLTATVTDRDLAILNSPAIIGANPGDLHANATLDGLALALAGLSLQAARKLQVILEDAAIHALRQQKGALTMVRSDHNTRARFIKRLFDDAGVPFVCPELDKPQPIETQAQLLAAKAKKPTARQPGISANAKLTVKNQPITAHQLAEADALLSVAASTAAGALPTLAMICAAIGESTLGGDPGVYQPNAKGYWGVLQGGSGQRGSAANFPDPHDTAAMAHAFLAGGKGFQAGGAIALSRTVGDPGQIATQVEASGQPAAFYGIWRAEAQKIVDAYTGQAASVLTDASVVDQPYQFQRGKTEDSWTCARRLADEVRWYLFVIDGAGHYYSATYLMATEPQMLVAPDADGIDDVTFNYMTSPLHADTITITCRAHVWDSDPGTVAEVSGYGPADGRWLTTDIVRASMASATTTVTLGRPQKAAPEPAPQTTSNPAAVSGDGVTGGTLRDRVVAAAAHAAALDSADPTYYRYSQAGSWKSDLFMRDTASNRSDCSSFVIQCWAKAGCQLPTSMQNQGFTGTFIAVGTKTSNPQPGDVCVYGPSTSDSVHCELYIGQGKTIGHGTARVAYDVPNVAGLNFLGYWTFGFLNAP